MLKKTIGMAVKLLGIYALCEFYIWFISDRLAEQSFIDLDTWYRYGLVIGGHLLIMLLCALGTTFGTPQFIRWQVVAFIGVVLAHSLCILNGMSPPAVASEIARAMLSMLPFVLPLHAVIQALGLGVFYEVRKKRKKA